MKKTVMILGTEYTVEEKNRKEDKHLQNCRGYMDWTSKRIVVAIRDEDDNVDEFDYSKKKTLRHEIVHAFIYESGLSNNTYCVDAGWAANEEMVDWIAIQFPKIAKVYQELEIMGE